MPYSNPAVLKREKKAMEMLKYPQFTIQAAQHDDGMVYVGGSTGNPRWNYKQPPRPFYQDMSRSVMDSIGMSYIRTCEDQMPAGGLRYKPKQDADSLYSVDDRQERILGGNSKRKGKTIKPDRRLMVDEDSD